MDYYIVHGYSGNHLAVRRKIVRGKAETTWSFTTNRIARTRSEARALIDEYLSQKQGLLQIFLILNEPQLEQFVPEVDRQWDQRKQRA